LCLFQYSTIRGRKKRPGSSGAFKKLFTADFADFTGSADFDQGASSWGLEIAGFCLVSPAFIMCTKPRCYCVSRRRPLVSGCVRCNSFGLN
jgi:hypothetical protein